MLERLLNMFRRDRVNADLDEEMQFHLAARTEEFMREGMTPEQAEAEARKWLGHSLLLREESREVKLFAWLQGPIEFYDDRGNFVETTDVFWFINHYESYCREHGIPINQQLYL